MEGIGAAWGKDPREKERRGRDRGGLGSGRQCGGGRLRWGESDLNQWEVGDSGTRANE